MSGELVVTSFSSLPPASLNVGRGLLALRRFTGTSTAGAASVERCEVCAAVLDADHDHVWADGALTCLCATCTVPGTRVPKRVLVVDDDAGAVFARLGLPVQLAYVVRDARRGLVARYPSPAGTVETVLESGLDASDSGLDVSGLAVDVEAFLFVVHGQKVLQLLVPIDAALALTGLLRTSWVGLHGGDQARADVAAHVARLLAREPACRG